MSFPNAYTRISPNPVYSHARRPIHSLSQPKNQSSGQTTPSLTLTPTDPRIPPHDIPTGDSFLSMRPLSCDSVLPESALFGSFQPEWPPEPTPAASSPFSIASEEDLELEREEVERSEALEFLIDEMSGWRASTFSDTTIFSNSPPSQSKLLPNFLPPPPPNSSPVTEVPNPASTSVLTTSPRKFSTRRAGTSRASPPVAFIAPTYSPPFPDVVSTPSAGSLRGHSPVPSSPAPSFPRPNGLVRTSSARSTRSQLGRSRSGSTSDVPTPSLLAAGRVPSLRAAPLVSPEDPKAPRLRTYSSAASTRVMPVYTSSRDSQSSSSGSSASSPTCSRIPSSYTSQTTVYDSSPTANLDDFERKPTWSSKSNESHDTSVHIGATALEDKELFTQYASVLEEADRSIMFTLEPITPGLPVAETMEEEQDIHRRHFYEQSRTHDFPTPSRKESQTSAHQGPHPSSQVLLAPPRASSRMRFLSHGNHPPSALKVAPPPTGVINQSKWSLDESGAGFVQTPDELAKYVEDLSPKTPTRRRLKDFINRLGRTTSNSSMLESYKRDEMDINNKPLPSLPLLPEASSPLNGETSSELRGDGKWVPTPTPVFSPVRKKYNLASGLGAKVQKRKVLVVGGIPSGDERSMQTVTKWCETFGSVRVISREPTGQVLVDYHDKTIADTISFRSSSAKIVGVGTVTISTASRRL